MIKTKEKIHDPELEFELTKAVNRWIDSNFNFIQLSVYEKCLDNMLYEHIEPIRVNYIENSKNETCIECGMVNDLVAENDYSNDVVCEDCYYDWVSNNNYDDNYPMWNTLFEFRSNSMPDEWIEHAQNVGLKVINQNDYFNVTLFATSAGHSFMSAYWIPLYLKCITGAFETYGHLKIEHL